MHPRSGLMDRMRTFQARRVYTLPSLSVADEYPQDTDTWKAQFSSWLSRAGVPLRSAKERDAMIEMANERTTLMEGRMESPHCECVLLAHLDLHWSPDVFHRYIGTSTRPCFICTMHLEAYRGLWFYGLHMARELPLRPWKIPKSWLFVEFENEEVYRALRSR
ncbi:hypothetical protein BOTBODRAFT_247351 [Botryobasidium botryosum FD-172 SS1]|uniref:Uncharacterized protein n=1 Tax=Botryobasidium botryosum (strain FD-172 SS1) TaxID=930990 RepID=A0A067LTA1_BOTB1|nr:hypothetical protein BOTBODRAFT_247351 [Botryobasidium botryosum FD-172 SS1]